MRIPEHVAPAAKKALKMPILLLFYGRYMDAVMGTWTRRSPSVPWIFGKKYTYLFVYLV